MWQFRLRTALAATLAIAVFCAWAADWRNQLRAEHRLIEQLDRPSHGGPFPKVSGWLPPSWLPDCVAKVGIFGSQFERVTEIRLVTDVEPPDLRPFKCLRSLTIAADSMATVELTPLKDLPYLKRLALDNGIALTDADCTAIAAISSLVELRAHRAPAEAIAQLRPMPNLRSLELVQVDSPEEIESINELKQLEHLKFSVTYFAPLWLHDLPKLRELSLDSDLDSNGHYPKPPQELQLRAMPQLTSVTAMGFHVGLADAPQLRKIDFTGDSLDAAELRNIQRCPNLESLSLEDISFERVCRSRFVA